MTRLQRQIAAGLIGILCLLLLYWLPIQASANPRYQVWVSVERGRAEQVLQQVLAEVPDALLRTEGDQTGILAGTFAQPSNAQRRQAQLQQLGLPVLVKATGDPLPGWMDSSVPPPIPPVDFRIPQPVDPPGFTELSPKSSQTQPPVIVAKRDPQPARPYHFPYAVLAESWLAPLNQGGHGQRVERLHQEAAQAFLSMQASAKAAGISLVPISGFRNWQTQAGLFQRQIQRRGSEAAAMRLSAPPGYSEHHTGYALDIGDGRSPQTHLQYRFADTSAFAWLSTHAPRYGFELSFPPDNSQGVSYEPWHWRYIGSPTAQAVFASAKGIR
ncbi:MAG: D-alanyl-D-alanine carboxypeptidase family protein [Cyanobacteriota bacterium]|nr:D-alanyl-D-alanine carboxypeptidase family protein [Cyanobacteriota bacterium]